MNNYRRLSMFLITATGNRKSFIKSFFFPSFRLNYVDASIELTISTSFPRGLITRNAFQATLRGRYELVNHRRGYVKPTQIKGREKERIAITRVIAFYRFRPVLLQFRISRK